MKNLIPQKDASFYSKTHNANLACENRNSITTEELESARLRADEVSTVLKQSLKQRYNCNQIGYNSSNHSYGYFAADEWHEIDQSEIISIILQALNQLSVDNEDLSLRTSFGGIHHEED
ncbi:hypothetical protein KKB99_05240 [bacterium]|nr:hypothetical protein [bacterium]MBU1025401.1 hypothetical protein [bacterium]